MKSHSGRRKMGLTGSVQQSLQAVVCLSCSVFLLNGCGASHTSQASPPVVAQTPTYYVSTSGDDSNAGTLASPWRTIQHAANMVTAGDTVYVRTGTYNEVVTMQKSGTASAPIVFSSYPGELATVDGTGLSVPNGVSGLFTIQNLDNITIEGFEVRNFTSSTTDEPIGIYIYGADNNIQILNNHIHNIAATASGCNAEALGVAVYGSSAPASINNLLFSGNEVDHLTTGCSESVALDGNVENFTVTNNLIHDNDNIGIDVAGFYGVAPNPSYDQARNGKISGNTVYNITSNYNPGYGTPLPNNSYGADGIYIDGGTQITIEHNLVHNVDIGIEAASENAGHVTSYVTVRNNVVYSDNSVGISIGGYAGPSTVGGSDHITIVNNTLYGDGTANSDNGEFQVQFSATNNLFENNIVYANTQGLFVNNFTTAASAPATLDYNLYYSTVGAANSTWAWQGQTYTGYNTYLHGTGMDAHSPQFLDPQFINMASTPPDLDIQATSPAVNAGSNLGPSIVGTADFAGHPRVNSSGQINIGAFEQ
ncbi:MAG: right-handed parallel beta-helix repeat-containing protein [Acidobacteriaceae bacterium]